ncbi:hypothetical protein Dimus_000240 [Dionaea muscipula]
MLTGRESLIRLIGRRRRFLPNRHRLLSSPTQSSLNLRKDRNSEARAEIWAEAELKSEVFEDRHEKEQAHLEDRSSSELVSCPVCGNQVSGEQYNLNSHLDTCLPRGTKRKLTQRTLLQFNFSSDATCSSEGAYARRDALSKSPEYVLVQKTDPHLVNCCTIDKIESLASLMLSDYGGRKCRLLEPYVSDANATPTMVVPTKQDGVYGPLEKHNKTNDVVDGYTMSLVEDTSALNADKLVGISKTVLKTYIVGRRFFNEAEIEPGEMVSFLRDHDNNKDLNAIKVVAATDSTQVIGFLPRDLAQYLSPLIDEYQLIFKGCVTSVPKTSLDVVPINMTCQHISSTETDLQKFTSLWENVLNCVDFGKKFPPSIAKYQHNFLFIVEEVLKSNHHLFTDDEKTFLESFNSLSDDDQRLFVRFYTRKGPWFRISNISYPEILDSQQAAKRLCEADYLRAFSLDGEVDEDDFDGILNLLTVTELREISFKLVKKPQFVTRKQDLVGLLRSSYEGGPCQLLQSLIFDRTGTCYRITSGAESLVWRVQRLFFLNGEQDLSAFLLADLGIVNYPRYVYMISDEVFSDRNDLLAYEEAIEVAQIMDEFLEENNSEVVLHCIEISESHLSRSSTKAVQSQVPKAEMLPAFLQYFSASWVYSKVVLLGVSFLEREHRYNDSIKLLKQLLINFTCDGRRGYWTLRLSIDLEHVGCLDESLSAAENGLQDPWVRSGPRIALQRRVIRLGKPPRRWKTPNYSHFVKRKIPEVHILGRPLGSKSGTKSRFYGEDGAQCGVEQLALQYYAGEGGGSWQGIHTESGIWLTIFGLLMWDIMFSNVPNVFRHRFQSAPLDLETDSFYASRKSLIESRLQNIHEGMAETFLIMSWESHVGTACRGVNWSRHSLSELRAAVVCIGGPCLALLCRLLAQDYRSWSSGMPDLLLWRFHGDYSGEAKLVEVKGPRDRLSEQQRAWLLVLMDCGFCAEVCKVSPPTPPTQMS